MLVEWVLVALAGAVVALLVALGLRGRRGADLPMELRCAELAFAERVFRSAGSAAISAKVDRAYRRRDGVFVLLELKTRQRATAYRSDVIEISAQRVALSEERGVPVARHAYVLIRDPDGRQLACRQVSLWSPDEVASLVQRRRLLLTGAVAPRANGAPQLCSDCSQRTRCLVARGGNRE